MKELQAGLLVLLAVGGLGVVLMRDPLRQTSRFVTGMDVDLVPGAPATTCLLRACG